VGGTRPVARPLALAVARSGAVRDESVGHAGRLRAVVRAALRARVAEDPVETGLARSVAAPRLARVQPLLLWVRDPEPGAGQGQFVHAAALVPLLRRARSRR